MYRLPESQSIHAPCYSTHYFRAWQHGILPGDTDDEIAAHVAACASCSARAELNISSRPLANADPALRYPSATLVTLIAYPKSYSLMKARALERDLSLRGFRLARLPRDASRNITRMAIHDAQKPRKRRNFEDLRRLAHEEIEILHDVAQTKAEALSAALFILRMPPAEKQQITCPTLYLKAALARLQPGTIALGAELRPNLPWATRIRPVLNLEEAHGMLSFELVHSSLRRSQVKPPRFSNVLGEIHDAIAADHYNEACIALRTLIDSAPAKDIRLEALRLFARSLRRLERIDEAYAYIQEAANQSTKRSVELSLVGDIFNELAYCHYAQGRMTAAEEAQKKAVQAHHACRDRQGLARDLLLTAHLQLNKDRMSQAHKTYSEVIALATELDDLRILSNALQGLGQVELEVGKLLNARLSLLQAAELFYASADHRGSLRILGELGRLETASGRYGEAQAYCDDQLRLMKKLGISAPTYEGATLARKGKILMAAKRLDEARLEFERALELQKTMPRHRFTPQLELARLHLIQNKPELAWQYYKHAAREKNLLPISDRWKLRLLHAKLLEAQGNKKACWSYLQGIREVEAIRERLPLRMRQSFFATSAQLFDGWIRCLLHSKASPAVILRATERARARGFLESLAREESALRIELAPSISRTWGRIQKPMKGIRKLVDTLPNDVVFCSLFALSSSLLLFRVSKGRIKMRQLPLDPFTLQELCSSAVNELLGQEKGTHHPDAKGDPTPPSERSALTRAAQNLLEPIWDWLKDLGDHCALGFVNHGPLTGFPWHCLPRPKAEGSLIDHCPVFYLPSLRSLEHMEIPRPSSKDPSLLCMANPLGDLPFSEQEADYAFRGIALRRKTFYGPKATLSAFRNHAREAKYMHLAIHARGGRFGQAAQLIFAPEEDKEAKEANVGRDTGLLVKEHPGAIHAAALAELEIPAEFVVISACQAGRGESADEQQGINLIPWAFMMSGTRSIIASITNLDDYHASVLMRAFHNHLAEGQGRALALAMAQREYQELLGTNVPQTFQRLSEENPSCTMPS